MEIYILCLYLIGTFCIVNFEVGHTYTEDGKI